MENKNPIEQLKESFYQATGKDFSAWEKVGFPCMIMPDLIYFYILFKEKDEKTLHNFIDIVPQYYGIDPVLPIHKDAISEFLSLFKEKNLSENQSFISAAVTVYRPYFKSNVLKNKPRPLLPSCRNGGEIFVDLITGFQFIQFYPDLQEDTFYYLVDTSLFVCEGLEQEKELFPHLNIRILRKNILALTEEDFHAPVSVLRAKNLFGYVDITKADIKRLQDLLRPGGRFVFQEYAYRKKKHTGKIKDWFKDWDKTIKRGNPDDKDDLDTFTYTKPKKSPPKKRRYR